VALWAARRGQGCPQNETAIGQHTPRAADTFCDPAPRSDSPPRRAAEPRTLGEHLSKARLNSVYLIFTSGAYLARFIGPAVNRAKVARLLLAAVSFALIGAGLVAAIRAR
jgi:hypothetical protein